MKDVITKAWRRQFSGQIYLKQKKQYGSKKDFRTAKDAKKATGGDVTRAKVVSNQYKKNQEAKKSGGFPGLTSSFAPGASSSKTNPAPPKMILEYQLQLILLAYLRQKARKILLIINLQ